jgi:ABC-type transport system substrate-binding protein
VRGTGTLLAILLSGCSVSPRPPAVTPPPGNNGSPTAPEPQATLAPSSAPTRYADRIRIGLVNPWRGDYSDFGPAPFHLSNLTPIFYPSDAELVTHFLFRALYRLDTVLTPVPDLAAAPCDTTAGGLTVTCSLTRATFSDGSLVTADDVKFTFDLERSDACPFANITGCPQDPADKLITAVTAVDPTTVRFELSHLDPSFITKILPGIYIVSKAVVDRQFQALQASAGEVGQKKLRHEGDDLQSSMDANREAACQARQADANAFASTAGLSIPDPRLFRAGPDGTLDSDDPNVGKTSPACAWLGAVRDTLYTAADTLDATGIDAEAIAYGILPVQWHPVGAGFWRLDETASVPGERIVLVASPTADPQPATPRIEFLTYPTRDKAIDALRGKAIDWLLSPWDEGPDTVRNLESTPDTTIIRYAHPASWTEIDFNVRPQQLFGDPNLRRALSLCIDRAAAVEAATDGTGAPAAGIFGPDFWAADPALTIPPRDVAAAKRLIEASGWQPANGTYTKDGKGLAADLWVRSEFEVRVKLAELIADEAKACGFQLTVKTAPGPKLLGGNQPIWRWPNHPPGSDKPFDMFLLGSVAGVDPDPAEQLECFASDKIDTKRNTDACNYLGYSSPELDRLIRAATGTLDIPQRASTYRRALEILDQDLPELPLFYPLDRVAVRTGLASLSGPLALDKPGWDWQLEKLVLAADSQ